MGYYFDWIERKWQPIDHERRLSPCERRQIERRRALVDELIHEIAHDGAGEIGLYAGLLARTLVKTDELLMRERGKRVVQLAPEDRQVHRAGR